MRTLVDSVKSDRLHQRIALVGRGLRSYDIQIAAPSETRFIEIWGIKEVGTECTFFLCERKNKEKREARVGFAIKTELDRKIQDCRKASMTVYIFLCPAISMLPMIVSLYTYNDQSRWGEGQVLRLMPELIQTTRPEKALYENVNVGTLLMIPAFILHCICDTSETESRMKLLHTGKYLFITIHIGILIFRICLLPGIEYLCKC